MLILLFIVLFLALIAYLIISGAKEKRIDDARFPQQPLSREEFPPASASNGSEPKRNLIAAKLVKPPKSTESRWHRLQTQWKIAFKKKGVTPEHEMWRLLFNFEGHQYEAICMTHDEKANRQTTNHVHEITILQDGAKLDTIGNGDTKEIPIPGNTGKHVLKIANGSGHSSQSLVGTILMGETGISIDGIPVHHTAEDPMYQLEQGLMGARVFLALIAANLLLGIFFVSQHKVEFMALQTLYVFPFVALLFDYGWFKQHHLQALKWAYSLAVSETILYVVDQFTNFSGFNAATILGDNWGTLPILWGALGSVRLAGLALLSRGIKAAKQVEEQNTELEKRLAVETIA